MTPEQLAQSIRLLLDDEHVVYATKYETIIYKLFSTPNRGTFLAIHQAPEGFTCKYAAIMVGDSREIIAKYSTLEGLIAKLKLLDIL